jgi:hypothetical protein
MSSFTRQASSFKPESTNFAENFFHTYKKVCTSLNIKIAPDCPNFKKAFPPSHFGKVLGINFDTKKLSWNLPNEKQKETLSKIQHMIEAKNCNLLQFQKLHGKLNDFANLCPLAKGFRANQNEFLKTLQLDENKIVDIPKDVKTELKFWSNCIHAAEKGFPILDLTKDAPFSAIEIFSDAPGAAFSNSKFIEYDRGAAAIVLSKSKKISFISKTTWPKNFQIKFAHKSHILETIGVLLPFLTNPRFFVNKHVLCSVDNWEKRAPKGDKDFENLFKILHLLEITIPCKIYIQHVYRMSCKFSKLADDLSRQKNFKKLSNQSFSKSQNFLFNRAPQKMD